MSTGQIVVMLCGWGVKVGWPILLVDKRVEGPIKLCDLINSCRITHSKMHYANAVLSLLYVVAKYSSNGYHALMLLVGRQEGHPACKNLEWWGAGMVICLERGADLHMAQLMPLPLTVSCFSEIQIGFTFLVPADPGRL